MRVTPVLVAFHTNGWTQQYVEKHLELFPEHQILVVDNNPEIGQKIERRHHQWDGEHYDTSWSVGWEHYDASWNVGCGVESKWLESHSGLIVLKAPSTPPPGSSGVRLPNVLNRRLTHGEALTFAATWLRENSVDVMLAVEPDCVLTGRTWYEALLEPIRSEGMWCTYSKVAYPTLDPIGHICPSMWLLEQISDGFGYYPFAEGSEEIERYHWIEGWDTGQKCWHECDKVGKAKRVELLDFEHLWRGSCVPYRPLKLL
ncbi:MAG: hypothetical protein ACXADB_05695 [Candidatus Hermodarchaeia archaeon]|jgi:hypothetical protein